jgi:hypothetical protein
MLIFTTAVERSVETIITSNGIFHWGKLGVCFNYPDLETTLADIDGRRFESGEEVLLGRFCSTSTSTVPTLICEKRIAIDIHDVNVCGRGMLVVSTGFILFRVVLPKMSSVMRRSCLRRVQFGISLKSSHFARSTVDGYSIDC